MSQAKTHEQFMLELVNAERAIDGAQPLTFDGDLNESTEDHGPWMPTTDTFSDTGAGGSSPGDQMSTSGFNFSAFLII